MAESVPWEDFQSPDNTATEAPPWEDFKQPDAEPWRDFQTNVPAEVTQAAEQQDMERNSRAPKWANDAAEAAINTAKGLIPRSVSDVAHALTPILASGEQLHKAYLIGRDVLDGSTLEDATRKHAPESFELADAGKTPALSKERFQAGFNTIAQMLMAAGIVHGHLKAGEVPGSAESPQTAERSIPDTAELSSPSPQAEVDPGELSSPQRHPVAPESLQSETAAVQAVPRPQPENPTAPIVEPSTTETVRLYHGATKGIGQAGSDFTTSLEYAQGYAGKANGGGEVWYVDVPKGLLKTHDEYGQPMTRVIVPDEIADKAKVLGEKGTVSEPVQPTGQNALPPDAYTPSHIPGADKINADVKVWDDYIEKRGGGNFDRGLQLLTDEEMRQWTAVQNAGGIAETNYKISNIGKLSDAEVVDALEYHSDFMGAPNADRYVKALAGEASKRGIWQLYAKRHPQSAEVIMQGQTREAPSVLKGNEERGTAPVSREAEKETVTEPVKPTGQNEPTPTSTEGEPAGTSNRAFGEIYGEDVIPGGTGVDTSQLLDNARASIGNGAVDPYAVLSATRQSGIANPAEYAVLAAEHERLVNDAVAKQKANDPSAPEAAKRAEDFANAIQPHKTAASDLMRLFQGELNYDLSTPFGMEQYMKAELGRAMKPSERPMFARRAIEIRQGENRVKQAITQSDIRVRRRYAKVRDIPIEEAASRVKEWMKDCQV